MAYTTLNDRPNIVPWRFLKRAMLMGLTEEFRQMINSFWNHPNSIRVLAEFLSYIEETDENINAYGASLSKLYFKFRNLKNEVIGVKLDLDDEGNPLVFIKKNGVTAVYQCINCQEDHSVLINLTYYSFLIGQTEIIRCLNESYFSAAFANNNEKLEIQIINGRDNNGKHLYYMMKRAFLEISVV